MKLRPFNGSSRISVCSTRLEMAKDVVSTCDTSASTLTVSFSCPTAMEKSTTGFAPNVKTTPFLTSV